MLSFYDAVSIATSPTAPVGTRLQQLLSERVQQWTTSDLLGMTHLLVVEPGDTEEAIKEEIGISPVVNPFDGERFGSEAFHPCWDRLQDHGGAFEMTIAVGNDGFAFVLFIQDREGVEPVLLDLCRTYAGRGECSGF